MLRWLPIGEKITIMPYILLLLLVHTLILRWMKDKSVLIVFISITINV